MSSRKYSFENLEGAMADIDEDIRRDEAILEKKRQWTVRYNGKLKKHLTQSKPEDDYSSFMKPIRLLRLGSLEKKVDKLAKNALGVKQDELANVVSFYHQKISARRSYWEDVGFPFKRLFGYVASLSLVAVASYLAGVNAIQREQQDYNQRTIDNLYENLERTMESRRVERVQSSGVLEEQKQRYEKLWQSTLPKKEDNLIMDYIDSFFNFSSLDKEPELRPPLIETNNDSRQ